jgi:type II secretory pathway pseudopilin PulG
MDKRLKKLNSNGLSVPELLVVALIFSALMSGVLFTLTTGATTWENTDVQIHLQEDLRAASSRMTTELQKSGSYTTANCPVTLNSTDLAMTAGTHIVTSASGGFTASMENCCLQISSGTNFVTSDLYEVTSVVDSNTIILEADATTGASATDGVGCVGCIGRLEALQVDIGDGGGFSGTDVVTFSIPVICEAGGSIMDANGDVGNWGAPLNWGCTDSSCMDADNDCGTVDYSAIQYLMNSSNQLIRRVLDGGGSTVKDDVLGENITDFQAVMSPDLSMVTLTVQVSRETNLNRQISASSNFNVHLRNRRLPCG